VPIVAYLVVAARSLTDDSGLINDTSGRLFARQIYRDERFCVGPSWPRVQRVLKGTDSENGSDICNRAFLLLLATYGLRASEAGHRSWVTLTRKANSCW
jgi:hypothetical protein